MRGWIRDQFRREIAGIGLPFLAFGVALNLTLGQLTTALKIPMYLDSVGTILVAVLCGPLSAMLTGSLANTLGSALGSPGMIFFIPVVLVIGAFTGFIASRGWFRVWYLVLLGGILQGLLAALVSAPISAYLFGGVMMAGTDFLVMYFRSIGHSLLESVLYQGFASDPIDKTVSYLIAFFIVHNLPGSILARFYGGRNITRPAIDEQPPESDPTHR
ncbi:MAG: ECF transporter S component [Ignavibacteria bacterium]|nr:ECF transporter S component [Ignavibacteria bacterium]